MSQHQKDPEPNGLDERFADWVDDRLEEQALRELEADLARDPELRRQAEEYRATVQTVREHLTSDEPPAELMAGVLLRVRRERSRLRRVIPVLASLTAAAALVLLVVLLNQPPDRGANRPDSEEPLEIAKVDPRDDEARDNKPHDGVPSKEPARKKAVTETPDRESLFKAKGDLGRTKEGDPEPDATVKQVAGKHLDAKKQPARDPADRATDNRANDKMVEEEDEEAEVVAKQTAERNLKAEAQQREVRALQDQVAGEARQRQEGQKLTGDDGKGAKAGDPAMPKRSRDRAGGRGGQGRRGGQEGQAYGGTQRNGVRPQVDELRRITEKVFQGKERFAEAKPTAPVAPRPSQPAPGKQRLPGTGAGPDRAEIARKPQSEAEKKDQMAATKLALPEVQVPVVLVQLAAAPTPGGAPEAVRRFRQVGGERDQAGTEQGFLGYLQQQPKLRALGNRILQQAQATDLTDALRKTGRAAVPQAGPAGSRFATQPGDQLFAVTGDSQQVLNLFQHLKTFLGAPPQLDFGVQQLPHAQFPGGLAAFDKQARSKKGAAAAEMQFLLVLREPTPTTRPSARRR
ncbi:MAG: anti-sigma factor family protein [Planctomycetota bacterium]|jgi:hypothetical protein